MANYDTTIYTNQAARATARDAGQSVRAVQADIRYGGADGALDFTLASGVATDDNFRLYEVEDQVAYVIPQLCSVTDLASSSGDVQGTFTLEKVDGDGTVTAISGTASLDNNRANFADLETPVSLSRGDYIQATVDLSASGDSMPTGEKIRFEIALQAKNC